MHSDVRARPSYSGRPHVQWRGGVHVSLCITCEEFKPARGPARRRQRLNGTAITAALERRAHNTTRVTMAVLQACDPASSPPHRLAVSVLRAACMTRPHSQFPGIHSQMLHRQGAGTPAMPASCCEGAPASPPLRPASQHAARRNRHVNARRAICACCFCICSTRHVAAGACTSKALLPRAVAMAVAAQRPCNFPGPSAGDPGSCPAPRVTTSS